MRGGEGRKKAEKKAEGRQREGRKKGKKRQKEGRGKLIIYSCEVGFRIGWLVGRLNWLVVMVGFVCTT